MVDITVKLPEDVIEALTKRAASNDLSLNDEVNAILAASVDAELKAGAAQGDAGPSGEASKAGD